MRVLRLLLSLLAAVVVLAPAVAQASTLPAGHRFLGVIKSTAARGPLLRTGEDISVENVTYHGGQVVHANTAYAIFWAPPGYSFPATYQQQIANYLTNVQAASGRADNVYAVATQYTDQAGSAAGGSTFGGAFTDTDPLPASGCADTVTPRACLTDDQLIAELNAFTAAHNLPLGDQSLYLLFTPQGIGSCYDYTSSQCAYSYYCAYHSAYLNQSVDVLYANLPYSTGLCQSEQQPGGTSADSTIDSLSHEHIEALTDPFGDGWTDSAGNEVADKCDTSYGQILGATTFGQYDQVLNGADYYLQQEWSNASGSCASSYSTAPSVPSASVKLATAFPVIGRPVSFDGSASSDQGSTLDFYTWDFGDGTAPVNAKLAQHVYAQPGSYTVVLTVTDAAGRSASYRQRIVVRKPSPRAAAVIAPRKPRSGQWIKFNAGRSSDNGSPLISYTWRFGDGHTGSGRTVRHRFARPGVYNVRLTVTDAVGADARKTLRVAVARP